MCSQNRLPEQLDVERHRYISAAVSLTFTNGYLMMNASARGKTHQCPRAASMFQPSPFAHARYRDAQQTLCKASTFLSNILLLNETFNHMQNEVKSQPVEEKSHCLLFVRVKNAKVLISP